MNKKFIFFITFLFLIIFMYNMVFSEELTIFVRNKPFNAKYLIKNGVVYVPLESFLKAMSLSWNEDNGILDILNYSQNKLKPISKEILNFSFLEKNFSLPLIYLKNILYVDLKKIAQNIGAAYLYNKDTGILDIFILKKGTQSDVQKAVGTAVPGSEKSQPGAKTQAGQSQGGAEKKDIIQTKLDYYQNQNPSQQDIGGELRGTATITNTSDQEVKNVTVALKIYDASNNVLHQEEWTLGDLTSKQVITKDFYWLNPNPLLIVTPKLEVNY
ncbi:MAG: hypothetical protein HYU63_05025 [Armatimonadetes bacterium]|nr:hypothetical protein [Armatimonadota bacterium]